MHTPDLVQLKSHAFEAIVPSFQDMPAMKMLRIFELEHGAEQFSALRDVLRDAMPPEKLYEYDSLSINDLMEIVAQWVNPHED